ncbi:RNA polymerase sigma factor [Micromonospora coriariae]|uniref:RNA polymerase sigma factor n=1 Tax=Micromonospora coriariae TaxID=285665 RepID=UPI002681DC35
MRDAQSFDELYRGTARRLLRYGYAVTGDHTEAQDLVQEAVGAEPHRTATGRPGAE